MLWDKRNELNVERNGVVQRILVTDQRTYFWGQVLKYMEVEQL
jgi:hypothetical protein